MQPIENMNDSLYRGAQFFLRNLHPMAPPIRPQRGDGHG